MSKTRKVNKELYRNYLQKARENLETAKESLQARRRNAATINAVHSGKSATDALTVFIIGVRHVGQRHEDALSLLQTLNLPKKRAEKQEQTAQQAARHKERLRVRGAAHQ